MEMKQKKMKVVTSILTLACLLVVLPTASGGDLEPSGSPAPTMKTLDEVEPRILIGPVTTPGDVLALYKITQSGSYYLKGDITVPPGKRGITVEADSVREVPAVTHESERQSSVDAACATKISVAWPSQPDGECECYAAAGLKCPVSYHSNLELEHHAVLLLHAGDPRLGQDGMVITGVYPNR